MPIFGSLTKSALSPLSPSSLEKIGSHSHGKTNKVTASQIRLIQMVDGDGQTNRIKQRAAFSVCQPPSSPGRQQTPHAPPRPPAP